MVTKVLADFQICINVPLMQKIDKAAIRKNQQIVSSKVLIFCLNYFADIKFTNKESVTTQVFVFSRLIK